MFKIGEFSSLTQVSVKTLRWYDEIGLLRPALVDPDSGYRYYSARQISQLARILILKNLGFSLEQIGVMLAGDIQAVQIRDMLHSRRGQLVEQMQAEQEKLNMVEAWLRQIESEGDGFVTQYEVLIKSVEPITVYAKRSMLATEDMALPLLESVWNDVMAANIRKYGPSITVYHQSEYKEKDIDFEAAIQVPPDCGLATKELPAIEKVASLLHYGSHEGLNNAYSALARWIEDNGYVLNGSTRTLFLTCGEHVDDPDKYVTEIQAPIISTGQGFICSAAKP
ncbi:MAG: MerR family transcriptional regulator [Candidatus Saccharibacteria bacterium]